MDGKYFAVLWETVLEGMQLKLFVDESDMMRFVDNMEWHGVECTIFDYYQPLDMYLAQ